MHSYDSNSPSGACFDASNGSQPRLADRVKNDNLEHSEKISATV